jgi:hypothetical protein
MALEFENRTKKTCFLQLAITKEFFKTKQYRLAKEN